jgi:hypothetical protein
MGPKSGIGGDSQGSPAQERRDSQGSLPKTVSGAYLDDKATEL